MSCIPAQLMFLWFGKRWFNDYPNKLSIESAVVKSAIMDCGRRGIRLIVFVYHILVYITNTPSLPAPPPSPPPPDIQISYPSQRNKRICRPQFPGIYL